ncbi:MAG: PAS domain S-box protein [Candidatus Marinimicrobia bacterium]|nr:PAS domain S-box protein [Candidatus Neomarinimicrobiota bacterium]MCF7829973.1 PAS domain S-box protein [Candidatus Neomarinimicrobiota bacterium]MCF7881873.1 PAS domain S-box protein [Candidatus Neomarinimicrobiota bacterium]
MRIQRFYQRLTAFFRHVRFGYLVFTSLLIVAVIFGAFELVERTLFQDFSESTMRWLYISRGVLSSLLLMAWAAWTVFHYREFYEERLEQTEAKYRDIIENSADAIITLDNNNHITTWNKGAEQIFGWEADEIIGESVGTIIPNDLIEVGELLCLAYGIKRSGYVKNYETERLSKSGQRVLVQLTENVITNENGDIVGRSQILRDISEVRINENQMRQSERLATVGHLAAGVAHEVGNPLTSISSLVQVMERKTDDEFIHGNLKKIREHISRITKIVRELVDFSRPSSVQMTETQLNDTVQSAVGLLKYDGRCQHIDFELELDEDLPKISCVPDQVHQVLINLLLNAIDAMQGQGEKIQVSTHRENGSIQISVRDEGIGMTPEVKEKVFEPFYTTKDVGKGTGLGLSVSHGIVSKMGGHIKVESEKNRGSTFTIELPINGKKA